MKAGFSRKTITPPMGTVMGGHPGTKLAVQVRDDLFVRAMAVCQGARTFVFVSADVLFVEVESVREIEKAVAEKGITPDRIFIGATHTHSGPITSGLFGSEQETDYVSFLHQAAAEAVVEAVKNLQEASLHYGMGTVPGLAFPARFLMKSGRVETHPWRDDPNIVAPEGPVDDRVAFLYALDEKGALLGGIFNYANHPQVMERENPAISADFPGSVERNIRASGARDAVILFCNGTCGDICPVNAQSTENYEVGEAWLEHMGKLLSEEVLRIQETGTEVTGEIAQCAGEVTLRIRAISPTRLVEAEAFLQEHNEEDCLRVSNYGVEGRHSDCLSLEDYLHTDAWRVQEYRDLLELQKIRARSETEKIILRAVRLGDVAVVFLPFEVFVELGLEIKARSPFEKTMVVELNGGSYGYLPTAHAFTRQGGYETITLRSSRFTPESGALVVEQALSLLQELHNQQNF